VPQQPQQQTQQQQPQQQPQPQQQQQQQQQQQPQQQQQQQPQTYDPFQPTSGVKRSADQAALSSNPFEKRPNPGNSMQ